jgi:hypothetical protein
MIFRQIQNLNFIQITTCFLEGKKYLNMMKVKEPEFYTVNKHKM